MPSQLCLRLDYRYEGGTQNVRIDLDLKLEEAIMTMNSFHFSQITDHDLPNCFFVYILVYGVYETLRGIIRIV